MWSTWGKVPCPRTQHWYNNVPVISSSYSANTRHLPNVGKMLAHRLRRWPSIVPNWVYVSCLLGTFSLWNTVCAPSLIWRHPSRCYTGTRWHITISSDHDYLCIYIQCWSLTECQLYKYQKAWLKWTLCPNHDSAMTQRKWRGHNFNLTLSRCQCSLRLYGYNVMYCPFEIAKGGLDYVGVITATVGIFIWWWSHP